MIFQLIEKTDFIVKKKLNYKLINNSEYHELLNNEPTIKIHLVKNPIIVYEALLLPLILYQSEIECN